MLTRFTHSGMTGAVTVVAISALLSACASKKETVIPISSVAVDRRTIVIDAQATGAVEPINVIEVKSKASGLITRMPVETGSSVRAGQLLVQVDTRDVQNQYDQSLADQRSAQANLDVAAAQKKRSDDLYQTRIITTQEFETAQLGLTQAQGQMVRANTNLDLAKQRLEDATVVAPVGGTIISKPVALGQVITSATGAFGGGTTLLTMADLSKVRMRAMVNETDIGNVKSGQPARVTVDAYPDKPFQGVVEKIEPQAVVVQSVTMFPVIISLENNEGFLKPGMNGEVSLLIERRENVVAVANDAVRTVREAATAAGFVGLNPDSVVAYVQRTQAGMGGGRNGGSGRPGADTPATQAVPMPSGDAPAAGGRQNAARNATQGSAAGTRTARASGAPGGTGSGGNSASRARTGLVFVEVSAGKYEPRLVRLGASNYDYSEVLSGLNEGDMVATLNVAALQAKRDQANDRFRSMTAVPGAPAATPARGGGGGGGGRPPGGN